jgi:cathepsin D
VFAFKIGRGQEKSQVEIGGYNLTENSLAGSPLIWHQLINTNYWSIPMINPQINGVAIKTTAKTAIVDTGSSYAVVPPSDYK